jgi:ABC-type spermidine/putrescine transport system permease subunit II
MIEMMTYWHGWPLARIVLLLLGLMFLMIFVQVTLFHYRQNFRHWSMWIPVIATPIDGLLLVTLAFYHTDGLRTMLTVLLGASLIAGLFGSYLHWRGVGERVGGYEMRNFLVGPPVMMPGMITGASLLGLIVLFWS